MPQPFLFTLPVISKKTPMAQTLPASPDPSSPLPRPERKRTGAMKAPRPRFQAADAALAALFCAASFAFSVSLHNGYSGALPAALLSALTAGMTYLLAWRNGGRLCGIIAGSLTALSLSFAQISLPWGTALFSLLALAALFAFSCDAMVAACALAGLAAAVRLDGALLGLALLALAGVRLRRALVASIGVFLAAALAGGAVRVFALHAPIAGPLFYVEGGDVSWLLRPAQAVTVWLLVALCAELTDPVRRVRWLPAALWGLCYLALAPFVHFGGASDTMLPLMPLVFVLAAGGLARLMPTLAGEVPAARYGLATLAIASVLGLRLHAEWPKPLLAVRPVGAAAAPVPLPAPAVSPPAAVVPSAMPRAAVSAAAATVRPKKPMPSSAMRGALAGRALVKTSLAKPAVALYTLRGGRLVRRTKWAVQWDLTHPKTKP